MIIDIKFYSVMNSCITILTMFYDPEALTYGRRISISTFLNLLYSNDM